MRTTSGRWLWLQGGLSLSSLLLCVLVLVPSYLYGSPSFSKQARQLKRWGKELIRLRSQVDVLAARVRSERTQTLLVLRGFMLRKRQLEIQVDSEGLRLRAVRRKAKRFEQKLIQRKSREQALAQRLTNLLQQAEREVNRSIPFRRRERSERFRKVRAKLQAGHLSASQTVGILWRALTDELRLGTLVERTEIPLKLPGESRPRLVKAVRLGTLALLVKLPSGEFGRLTQQSGKWTFQPIRKSTSKQQLQRLFRDLEKQVRSGLYQLPLGVQVR